MRATKPLGPNILPLHGFILKLHLLCLLLRKNHRLGNHRQNEDSLLNRLISGPEIKERARDKIEKGREEERISKRCLKA